VARRRHRGLDDEDVDAGFDGDGREFLRVRRCAGDRSNDLLSLHLAHALADEVWLDGLGVDVLQEGGYLVCGRVGDFLEERRRILIASVDALQVQHRQAAEAPQLRRERLVDYRVRGRCKDRYGKNEVAQIERHVREIRIDGEGPRDDGYLVETIGVAHRLGRGGAFCTYASRDLQCVH